MTVLGIDVSHHQGDVDWHGVARSDVKFVYVKATEGALMTDPKFANNWAGARDAGLLHGAYHFAHPGLDPEVQATHFASIVMSAGPGFGELPPALDLELSDGRGPDAVVEWAKTFLRVAEAKLQRQFVIYTGGFWKTHIGDVRVPELQRMLWMARYGKHEPIVPGNWPRWDFWQFTDGRTGDAFAVPGIKGPCDCNRFRGELSELQALLENGAAAPAIDPAAALARPVFVWPHVPALRHADVTTWQKRMKELGYAVDVDGVYGPECKAACVAFQRNVGLPPDGIVSTVTWDKTFEVAS